MPDKSLDRVKELKSVFKELYYLADNEIQTRLVTIAILEAEKYINSELQNLRQQLASEVEGLKKPPVPFVFESYYEVLANNQAIDKVLAIIEGKK